MKIYSSKKYVSSAESEEITVDTKLRDLKDDFDFLCSWIEKLDRDDRISDAFSLIESMGASIDEQLQSLSELVEE